MRQPPDPIPTLTSAHFAHSLRPRLDSIEARPTSIFPSASSWSGGGRAYQVIVAMCVAMLAPSVRASPSTSLYDGPDGATCNFFNLGAKVAWKNKAGDWTDAKLQAQGNKPFSTVVLSDRDPTALTQVNVTSAWHEAAKANARQLGVALVALPGGGPGIAAFYSRDESELLRRPALLIEYADGHKDLIGPSADTYTDCTTTASLGRSGQLLAGGGRNVFVEFDLSVAQDKTAITKATLQLFRTPSRYGNLSLGVFLLARPLPSLASKGPASLAASYSEDRGIEKDANVFMATGFDSTQWQDNWTTINTYGGAQSFDTVDRDTLNRFEPLIGRSLRVRIPQGSNLGLDMRYDFKKKFNSEPEEVYFRYYLRLADDWRPTVDGGKMPGFAGTYGVAAWGDRPADPMKGWSMRGSFNTLPAKDNPLHAYVTMGTYATHPDPNGRLGEVWPWTTGMNGLLERNRWYCIEQYIKLNTPGITDGIFRVWVDGRLAFDKIDMRVRDTSSLKVEYIWMNVYHGGRAPAPQDMHLYIDNVVIARRYVGPMTRP